MTEEQEITATVKPRRTRRPRLPVAKVLPHQAVSSESKKKLLPKKSLRIRTPEVATISW
jgi:hypothetical protein